jgi:hypothetical protein
MESGRRKRDRFIGGAIAWGFGMAALLGGGGGLSAADPDVYMAELETYLEADPTSSASGMVEEIAIVLDSEQLDEEAQAVFYQSLNPEESTIAEHAVLNGWSVTLQFLRDLLLMLCQ